MENKNKQEAGQKASSLDKKTWMKPDMEIISHNNVQSGQAGFFQEATFTGVDPFTLYNS